MAQVFRKSRYPGVKPFSVEDSNLFFGREEDVEKLFSLIFVKQTVVLYGKSGYGKSSLFNAGITPKLNADASWNLFNIRFNYFSDKNEQDSINPVETIRTRLQQDLKPGFVSPLDALIPNENSFWYWLKTLQFQNKINKFILFFDQFEELFTYPQKEVDEFSELLSQLLYNKIPVQFRKKMMELDNAGTLSEELHDFLYDLPEIKVVFAIRSDRLAQMNALTGKHPTILQNCYELDALTRSQAASAIIGPASLPQADDYDTPTFTYTEDAIEKILDSVTNTLDKKTETSTLQIVCRYVEDDLVHEQHHTQISSEILGDITEIFKHYYEGILNRLTPDEKSQTQRLIEDELIDSGRRNPLTVSYINSKFGISEELLQRLERTSLLRKERDASGRILYEVSHDTLVEAIEKVARGRRLIEEQKKREELEQKVRDEQKRAEMLIDLNRKIVAKSRRANIFTVVAILAALVACVFIVKARIDRRNAISSKTEAEEARKKAIKAQLFSEASKRNAIISLCVADYAEITGLTNKARQFKDYGEYGLAMKLLKKAAARYRDKLNYMANNPEFLFTEKEILLTKKDTVLARHNLRKLYAEIERDSIICTSQMYNNK